MKHMRFLVEAIEIFPKNSVYYKAKVEAGIDPENDWRLIYSFKEFEDAKETAIDDAEQFSFRKYRVRDFETDEVINHLEFYDV